ncbi:MAG: RNA polymerase sigma factor, partial [Thermomicrobiales bacterium]
MGDGKTITMSALDDARFIRRIASQDVAAFERLYDDLSPGVYGFLLTVTPHESTAERLLVETFHRAWKAVPSFRG